MSEIVDALNRENPPTREQLFGSIQAWGGTARQLLEEIRKGNLKVRDRDFAGGYICTHFMSAPTRVIHMLDGALICHTPIGCTCWLTAFYGYGLVAPKQPLEELPGFRPYFTPPWYGTCLTEEDIIFGGEDKLRKTILLTDQQLHPKSIWITRSCSAAMIGDDIDAVAKSVQPEVKATIVPLHTEPLHSKLFQSGLDAWFHGWLTTVIKKPKKKQDDLVYLVVGGAGMNWKDKIYCQKLLEKLGLRAVNVPYFATTKQIETMSEAALVIALCPAATHYLVQGLHELYGVPYINDIIPFGIARTEEWLRRIGKLTDRERQVEWLIKEERTKVMPEISTLREQLKGIKIFVSAGASRAFHLPYMLVNDFGMKLVGINSFEFGEHEVKLLENLGHLVGNLDFLVHIADNQAFEMVNYLKKMDVDVVLGHIGASQACTLKAGITTISAFPPRHSRKIPGEEFNAQMGFKGVVTYGKYLLKCYRNSSFGKNVAAHTHLPFKDSWFQQEPFSKISDCELDREI